MKNLKPQLEKLLLGRNPRTFGAVLRPHTELKQHLIQVTDFLPNDCTLAQRIYHVFHSEYTSVPLCKNCQKKPAKFNSYNKGYTAYCGTKCANSDDNKKKKTEAKWIEKYGSLENRKKAIRDKTKKALLKKTGHTSNFENPSWQQKNNGGQFAWDEKTREKRKNTCLTKYGVQHAAQAKSTKAKTKQTWEQNYNGGHPMRDRNVFKKREQTFLNKYGVPNPRMHPDVVEKAKQTCLTKYGVPNPAQRHIKNFDLWDDVEFIKNHFINENGTIRYREASAFFGCFHEYLRDKFTALGIEWKPYTGYSHFETEIGEFIQSLDDNITIEYRNTTITKPYHVDLWLPDYKIGIEFHGLTWHSFGNSPNNKHLEKQDKARHRLKADAADKAGIKLFQIFENEWIDLNKQSIWKSMLCNALGFSSSLYARQCRVVALSTKQCHQFITDNHIQGHTVGESIRLGLVYEKVLVAAMTFGKCRFSKQYDWELLRFCNKKGYRVVGGFSKLLSYFRKQNPGSVITYANRRWSKGTVYSNVFEKIRITDPGFFYYHPDNMDRLFHRIQFQKHRLKDRLKIYDANLTADELIYLNGYRKIYDAGQISYIIK